MQTDLRRTMPFVKHLSRHAAALALLVLAAGSFSQSASAQANQATADRSLLFSFFGGGTASYTGIQGVKNYGITAGVDARFRPFFGVRPAIEVRGFFPLDVNALATHRDVLAGLRVEKSFGRFLPYVDGLVGRSSIHYNPYLPSPDGTFAYTRTTSNVYSPGGGVEYSLSPRFALKGDFQFQRYSVPVVDSGHVFAKTVTLGVTYHLFGGEAPR